MTEVIPKPPSENSIMTLTVHDLLEFFLKKNYICF